MEGKLMNELIKNVIITSAVIGGIKLYGQVKYRIPHKTKE